MTLVEVEPGVRLYARELGSGPAVVLVAGFGLNHEVWDGQVRRLAAAGHRVVCVDQRGHGNSDKPLDGYEVDRLARDLGVVLEALGVRQCSVVGWSFGGQVAFRLAAESPELVAQLVLVGSNAVRASRSAEFPFGMPPEKLEPQLVAAETANRLRSRRETIASGFAAPPDEDTLRWLLDQSLQMPSWSAVACYRSMLYADLTADLSRVKMPVLQVVGAQDPIHSAKGARWLHERLGDSTLVELAGCGHYPMIEAPAAFAAALENFLS